MTSARLAFRGSALPPHLQSLKAALRYGPPLAAGAPPPCSPQTSAGTRQGPHAPGLCRRLCRSGTSLLSEGERRTQTRQRACSRRHWGLVKTQPNGKGKSMGTKSTSKVTSQHGASQRLAPWSQKRTRSWAGPKGRESLSRGTPRADQVTLAAPGGGPRAAPPQQPSPGASREGSPGPPPLPGTKATPP